MIYFALTARPPFLGESAFAVMMAHSRDPVVPPTQIRSDIPPDLEGVVLRCLAKKPEDRYQSVTALREALAACASAADWDAQKADRWWAERISPYAVPAPASPAGGGSAQSAASTIRP